MHGPLNVKFRLDYDVCPSVRYFYASLFCIVNLLGVFSLAVNFL